MLPRWSQRNGRWHIDLGWLSIPAPGTSTQPPSPIPGSPTDEENISLLPFDVRPSSPTASDISGSTDGFSNGQGSSAHPLFDAVRRARSRFASFTGPREREPIPQTPSRPRRQRHSRGVLFFLPAFFTQSQDMDTPYRSSAPIPHIQPVPLHRSNSPLFQPEKRRHVEDIELGEGSSMPETNHRLPHRPTYENRTSSYTSTGTLVDVDVGQTSSASRT